MKKILITGANSYIGTSFEKWVKQWNELYKVDTLDMMEHHWKEKDFSEYDVVFHVAGIAHQREGRKNKDLYYKVNRDLVYETAKKAKEEGVKQFVFLSSMSVYGLDSGVIDENTKLSPKSFYGQSKLQAEQLINGLECDNFKILIVRPPMVYGKDCKGNYQKLSGYAKKAPIFPNYNNQRSMIYIDNLCEFIKNIISMGRSGLYFPQNSEYVNTSELVNCITQVYKKDIKMTKLFNPFIKLFQISIVKKVFGDLVYKKDMSDIQMNYQVCDFKDSIVYSERGHCT